MFSDRFRPFGCHFSAFRVESKNRFFPDFWAILGHFGLFLAQSRCNGVPLGRRCSFCGFKNVDLRLRSSVFAEIWSPLFRTRSLRTLEPEHGEVTTRANGQFFYDFGSILAVLAPLGPFGPLVGPFGGGLFVALLAPYFNIRRHI